MLVATKKGFKDMEFKVGKCRVPFKVTKGVGKSFF